MDCFSFQLNKILLVLDSQILIRLHLCDWGLHTDTYVKVETCSQLVMSRINNARPE